MHARRFLIGSLVAVLVADLVGGPLSVAAGVNTWSEAWGSSALLAAPLPMIVAQIVLTVLALRMRSRWAAVPAGLLTVACLLSVVSGFFDGGLGNEALIPALSTYQALLLAVTALLGAAAAQRAVSAGRRAP